MDDEVHAPLFSKTRLVFGWGFVDYFVFRWDLERLRVGIFSLHLLDGECLFANTRIGVLDEHVDMQLFRIPIFMGGDQRLIGAADGCGNG